MNNKTAARNDADAARGHRIALLVGSMVTGGAQRVAFNLAGEFADRGFAVDLIPIAATGRLLSEIPPGVSLRPLGRRGRSSVLRLRKYLREARPSALIAFTFHVNLLAALAHLALGNQTRLVLSVHSTFSGALREYSPVTRALFYPATLLFYRLADLIVAVSDGAAEDLAQVAHLDRKRIVTIHNPVIGRGFQAAADEPVEHPFLAAGAPLLVAVGRLSEAKDYPTLIRAFARVRQRIDARLLVVGEGDRRGEIEALISDSGVSADVDLVGHLDNPLPWMKAADLFVMTSKREGFGNVLVEAMATGTPVVSTDCPHGPAEILENGKWGKLVPVGDDQALADAIVESLRSGGVDARARALDFTVAAAAEKYLALVGC